ISHPFSSRRIFRILVYDHYKIYCMKRPFTWKRIRWFVGIIALHFSFSHALAQTTLSGTVTDASATPLIGVSIQVKGKVVGTITNSEGRFTLRINDRPPMTLVASSIGYNPKEIVVDQATEDLAIMLEEQSIVASEVVVSA